MVAITVRERIEEYPSTLHHEVRKGGSPGPTSIAPLPSRGRLSPVQLPRIRGHCQALRCQARSAVQSSTPRSLSCLAPQPAVNLSCLPTAPPPGEHPAPSLPLLAPLAAPALRGVPGTRDTRVLRVPNARLRGCVLSIVLGRYAGAVSGLHTPRGALLLRLQR